MTADEWGEIVDWLAERYPDSQYTAEDVIVIFTDLKDFDPSDVWSAVYWFHEQGREFPPNASMLLSRTLDERLRSARADMYRGLPESVGERPPTEGWIKKRFGVNMTGTKLIARIHRERGPCKTKTCEIHYSMKVGAR